MSFSSAPQQTPSAQWPASVNFPFPASGNVAPQPPRYAPAPTQSAPGGAQYPLPSAMYAQPMPSPRTTTVNGYHSTPSPAANGVLPPYAAPQAYAPAPAHPAHYAQTPQSEPQQASSVSHTPQQQHQPLPSVDRSHQDPETQHLLVLIKALQAELLSLSYVPLDSFDPALFPIDPRTGQKMTEKMILALSSRYDRAEGTTMDLKLYRIYLDNVARARAERAGVQRQPLTSTAGLGTPGAAVGANPPTAALPQPTAMSRPGTSGSMGPPHTHQRLPSAAGGQVPFNPMGPSVNQMTPSQQQAYLQNNTAVFHRKLVEFHSQSPSGVPPFPAVVEGRPINLYKLYYFVMSAGGSANVSLQGPGPWQKMLAALDIPLPQGSSMYREDTIRALQAVWGRYLSTFEASVKARTHAQQVAAAASQGNGPTPASPVVSLHQGSPPPGMGAMTGPGTPRETPSQIGTPVPGQGAAAMSPPSRTSTLVPPSSQPMPTTGYPQPLSLQVNPSIASAPNSASHPRQSSVPATPTMPGSMSTTRPGSIPPQALGSTIMAPQGPNSLQIKTNGTSTVAPGPVSAPSTTGISTGISTGTPSGPVKSKKGTPVHGSTPLGPAPDKPDRASSKRKRGKKDEDSPALSMASISRSASVSAPNGPGPFTTMLTSSPKPSGSIPRLTSQKLDEPPAPPAPTGPVPRKRKRVEYCPLTKPPDVYGGWEVQMAEEGMARVAQARGRRTMEDLGLVDLTALTMSLRSRLAPEVVYALNALNLLSQELRIHAQDHMGVLDLKMEVCDEVLEELLDLLEETAFDDAGHDVEPVHVNATKSQGTMRQDLIKALEEEARMSVRIRYGRKPVRVPEQVDDLRPVLGQMEVILSILNIIRAFASCEDNGPFMCAEPRLLRILICLCGFPATVRDGKRVRSSLEVSALDRLRIRRDVLQIVCDLGHHLRLNIQSLGVCTSVLELATYFLEDGVDVPRPSGKVDMTTPLGQAHFSERQVYRRAAMSGHVDAALGILSRAALVDSNRSALGRCDVKILDKLIELVFMILPLTQEEFMDLHDEVGLTRVEMESMALFNLVFLSPTSIKRKLHQSPMLGRAVVRLIEPLIAYSPIYSENPYSVLIERSIEVLNVCSDAVRPGHQDLTSRQTSRQNDILGTTSLRDRNGHDVLGADGNGGTAGIIGDTSGSEQRLDWFGGGFMTEDRDGANGMGSHGDFGDAPPLAGLRAEVEAILRFQGIGQGVFDNLSILLNGRTKTTR